MSSTKTNTKRSVLKRGRGSGLIPLPHNLYPQFEDTQPQAGELQIYGMFKRYISMSNVCTQIALALTQRLGALGLYGYDGTPFAEPALRQYSGIVRHPKVSIFHGLPVRKHLPPGFFKCPVTIGLFVCETDRIHCDWAHLCNDFDLIVVPSEFCRRAFFDSGVHTPIMVVAHGLEPEYRPYREIRREAPLIFFNTFHASSIGDRKSAAELVRCFTQTFGSPHQAILKLRTEPTTDIKALIRKYDRNNVVELVPVEALSTTKFARLYSDIHCTVHPSKGEGFGLIPFQSIACERPVIAPPVTGMSDYLTAENAVLLRTGHRVPGVDAGNQTGTYFDVDEVHLCECLRHIYDHWENEYVKVRAAAPDFRERYQWPRVLAEFVELIESLLAMENIEQRRNELPGVLSRYAQGAPLS